MQETINNINKIIKQFVYEERLSLENLKTLRNKTCDSLNTIVYNLKKNEDCFLGDNIAKVKKIIKLTENVKYNIFAYYNYLKKEYDFKTGKLSKTLQKHVQTLYLLNLINQNEGIDDYLLEEIQEEDDGCIAGSLKKCFNKTCYVFGTENDIEKAFTGKQGNNVFGMQNDCGIACVTQILILAGKSITENDVARVAISEGLCNIIEHSMRDNGATSAYNRVELLGKFGIKSKIEQLEQEQIAYYIEHGFGIIASVDSGLLWGRESELGVGHAIVPYGTIREASTGKLLGFVACDTGSGDMRRIISCDDYAKMSNFDRGINITQKAIRGKDEK